MNQLRCSVTSCANNANDCCCRPDINVGDSSATDRCETKCKSFSSKGDSTTNSVYTESVNPNLYIKCSVNECVHYESGKCVAAAVDIDGQGASTMSETQCSTFKNKK